MRHGKAPELVVHTAHIDIAPRTGLFEVGGGVATHFTAADKLGPEEVEEGWMISVSKSPTRTVSPPKIKINTKPQEKGGTKEKTPANSP